MDNPILWQIADNPVLIEALKDAFKSVYSEVIYDMRVSNELLGQNVRSFEMMKLAVERVFIEIAKHATIQPKPDKQNPAR